MRKPLPQPHQYAPLPGRSYVALPDGRIMVDPSKKDIWPYTLVTEPEAINVEAAIEMCPGKLAGGIVQEAAVLPIDNKGPFEITSAGFAAEFTSGPNIGQATDQFMVALFDPGGRQVLMNREVHVRTIAGGFGSSIAAGFGTAASTAGGRPFIWPETFFMEPRKAEKAMFLAFRNLNTEAIKIKWAFHGIRYYNPNDYEAAIREKQELYGDGRVSSPYFYTTDTDVRLDGGANFDFQIRITDEADVEIFKMMKFSDFDFLWRFQEKGEGRFLDSAGRGLAGVANGAHSDFGWGDAEFPFIPFETLYLEQNYKLNLRLVNALTSNANRIFPTLFCRKIAHVG